MNNYSDAQMKDHIIVSSETGKVISEHDSYEEALLFLELYNRQSDKDNSYQILFSCFTEY